jgi:hypothetical protein
MKKIGDVQLSRRFKTCEVKLRISFDFKPQQWDTLELLYDGRDTLTVLIQLFLGQVF